MLKGVELLHPEDVLFFGEVAAGMRRVAAKYGLFLGSVGHLPDERSGFDTDRFGDCEPTSGAIRLLLRAKVNGQWTSDPMSPEEVWDTAAHELAHLRFVEHGKDHAESRR